MKRILRTPQYDIWDLENGYFKSVEPNKRPTKWDFINTSLLSTSIEECVRITDSVNEMLDEMMKELAAA